MQKNDWFDLYRSYGVSRGQSKPDKKGGYIEPRFPPRTVSTYLFCQLPPLTIVILMGNPFPYIDCRGFAYRNGGRGFQERPDKPVPRTSFSTSKSTI